jgi:hypothetical protein
MKRSRELELLFIGLDKLITKKIRTMSKTNYIDDQCRIYLATLLAERVVVSKELEEVKLHLKKD